MEVVVCIPARLEAARLPGKLLLADTGKTVLQHTWEAAKAARLPSQVYICTADPQIEDAATRFGAAVLRTSPDHVNGTSRIAEAVLRHGIQADTIINLQGDEPTVPASALDRLARNASRDLIGTIAAPLNPDHAADYSTVKVAVSGSRCLYFSRAPLAGAMQHVGVYAYPRRALSALRQRRDIWRCLDSPRPLPPLMQAENLEQLYFLETGWQFEAVVIDQPTIGVDTQEDYERFVRWWRERENGNGHKLPIHARARA